MSRYMKIFDYEVLQEMNRQNKKWGFQSHDAKTWGHILNEEVGEVSKAIIEGNGENLMEELVQCVAVIKQWILDIERRNDPKSAEIIKQLEELHGDEKIEYSEFLRRLEESNQ